MGNLVSIANDFPTVKKYQSLIKKAKDNRLVNMNRTLPELTNSVNSLFSAYDRCLAGNKLDDDISENFERGFDKINRALEGFERCVNYLIEHKSVEIKIIFCNDLISFMQQTSVLSQNIGDALLRILQTTSINAFSRFYFELSLFEFSFDVINIEKPPYYRFSMIPLYKHRSQIMNARSKYLNVLTPHGSGKTLLVPLLMILRSFEQNIQSPNILLIIQNETLIHSLRNIFSSFNEDESFLLCENVHEFVRFSRQQQFQPILYILSPLEALQIIHLKRTNFEENQQFISKSTFIIDDVHSRTVYTDVLLQDLLKQILSFKTIYSTPHKTSNIEKTKLIFMSAIENSRFLEFVGRHKTINYEEESLGIPKKKIICHTISEINKYQVIKTVTKHYSLLSEEELDISNGSSIVYLSSNYSCFRFLRNLERYYSREDSPSKILVLKSRPKSEEKLDLFYDRLLNEITLRETEYKEEHESEDNLLFILPILLNSEHLLSQDLELLRSTLPPIFINKVSRLIITTSSNETSLTIPDLTAIFDSGTIELSYYEPTSRTSELRETLLPHTFMEERFKLLGHHEDGLYYYFEVEGMKRPEEIIPDIQRINLTRSILELRKFNIALEKQLNLPNEPNAKHLSNSLTWLSSKGILIQEPSKSTNYILSDFGRLVVQFSNIDPIYSISCAKFKKKPIFGYLLSLIIENASTLIKYPNCKFLRQNYCRDSDLVTILLSLSKIHLQEMKEEEHGFSVGTLSSIYQNLINYTENPNIEPIIRETISWGIKEPGGLLSVIDEFLLYLNEVDNYFNEHRATFKYIVGTGRGYQPSIICRLQNPYLLKRTQELNHDKTKIISEVEIEFHQRPGWQGLSFPGESIVLSIQTEETRQIHHGLLIHRNPQFKDETSAEYNPGVISKSTTNPSLNSFFFVSLFEAYWNGESTINDFVGIYHSKKPNPDNAFLIHMTEIEGETYLNYCPKSKTISSRMNDAIPILSSLMPFLPRSILIKNDSPLCCVEITSIGTQRFTTNIRLVNNDAEANLPNAYPLNRTTLTFAYQQRKQLALTMPLIRFGMTGESLIYKFKAGRLQETDFEYPDTRPSLPFVFDNAHASHLVLLVDRNHKDQPLGLRPLPWVSPDVFRGAPAAAGAIDRNNTIDETYTIEIASKLLSCIGSAQRSADIFFLRLNGGFATIKDCELPNSVSRELLYEPKDHTIRVDFYELIKIIQKNYMPKMNLTNNIPIREFSSNSSCGLYRSEANKESINLRIKTELSKTFGINSENIQSLFLGDSLLVIRIENLCKELIVHPRSIDIFDNSYQTCQADERIRTTLSTLGVPITSINHQICVDICIQHHPRMHLNEAQFTSKVEQMSQKYGFLLSAISDYQASPAPRILGEIHVELTGSLSGATFANEVIKAFPISTSSDLGVTMTMTATQACCMTMKTRASLDPRLGSAPEVKMNQVAYQIPSGDVEAMKELLALRSREHTDSSRWKFDDRFQVLIIPLNDDEAAREMLKKVRKNTADLVCFYACSSDPPNVLPQSLFVYDQDGSVRRFGICEECMRSSFTNNDSLMTAVDPITLRVDPSKLREVPSIPDGIATVDCDEDGEEIWPQVPLGQLALTLLGDTGGLNAYVKCWFTVVSDFTIRKAANIFTFCPIHEDFPLLVPKAGSNLRCPHCDHFFCADCRSWHRLSEPCAVIDPNIKRCPRCNVPTYKYDGCNHISCTCGCHWCYKCPGKSPDFKTSGECYSHMTKEHGGYFT